MNDKYNEFKELYELNRTLAENAKKLEKVVSVDFGLYVLKDRKSGGEIATVSKYDMFELISVAGLSEAINQAEEQYSKTRFDKLVIDIDERYELTVYE